MAEKAWGGGERHQSDCLKDSCIQVKGSSPHAEVFLFHLTACPKHLYLKSLLRSTNVLATDTQKHPGPSFQREQNWTGRKWVGGSMKQSCFATSWEIDEWTGKSAMSNEKAAAPQRLV